MALFFHFSSNEPEPRTGEYLLISFAIISDRSGESDGILSSFDYLTACLPRVYEFEFTDSMLGGLLCLLYSYNNPFSNIDCL